MATGMDDFGVFFSDSMGAPGQSEGDASMLKLGCPTSFF